MKRNCLHCNSPVDVPTPNHYCHRCEMRMKKAFMGIAETSNTPNCVACGDTGRVTTDIGDIECNCVNNLNVRVN